MKKLLVAAVAVAVSFTSVGADVAVSPSGGPVTLPDGTVIPTSYTTLRGGWNAVTTGATLWIDDGTYVAEPLSNKDMYYTTKSFAVRSVNGNEKTILDFRRTADDDSAKWCFYINNAAGCTFEGLTIINACCSSDKQAMLGQIPSVCNCVFSNNWTNGKGIIEPNVATVISNCTFAANGKDSNGDNTKTYCVKSPANNYPAVALIDCVFTNNVNSFKNNGNGGVFDLLGAGNQLIRCTIVDNKTCGQSGVGSESLVKDCVFKDNLNYFTDDMYAMGAGLRLTGAGNTLLNCVFTNNVGPMMAALMANGNSVNNTTVSNCVFVDNRATMGGHGAGRFHGSATIVDCEFRNNTAENSGTGAFSVGSGSRVVNTLVCGSFAKDEPGAIYLDGTCTFENVTVANNTKKTSGGIAGISKGSKATLINCVFYENKANGSRADFWTSSNSDFFNCAAEGKPNSVSADSADNNFAVKDFKFVDAANGDYRPAKKSPLIDNGQDLDWMVGAKDLGKKNARILGKRVDIGCYEFMPLGLMLLLR